MKKRLLAMLLCVAMVASLLTVGVAADVGEENVESTDVVEHTVEIDTYSASDATNASASSSTEGLISFTVTDVNGDDISLLDGGVSIRLGEQYTFKVQFSDPDSIKSVYVTSTIGDEVKMLEAVRSGDIFVTSGYFDSDPDYTPGSVGVKYTEIIKNIDVNAPVDWQSMVDTFEDKPEVKAIEADGENVNAQFDLSGLLKSESEVLLDVAVELYDNTYGTSFDDFIGAYKNYEELLNYELNDNTTVYVDKTGIQTYFMLVEEKVDNGEKFVKLLMEVDDDQNLKDVAEALGEVGTIIDFANSYLDINAEANELREEISSRRDLNTEEAEALNDKVDEYESDKQLFNLSMTVLPLIAASAAPTAGASIIFGGIVGMISVAANYFWDYRVGMITGSEPVNTSFVSNAHGTLLTHDILREMELSGSLKSGTYCLEKNTPEDIVVEYGTVTLCLHGYGCDVKNNGGTVIIYDCGQNELKDGLGHVDITNNDGTVRFNSGSGSIYNYEGGKISVYDGSVRITDYDPGSEINIYGGTIGRIRSSDANILIDTKGTTESIYNTYGETIIYDGTIKYINTTSGRITVYNGTIGDESHSISGGESSSIEIHNGQFKGFIGCSGDLTIWNGAFFDSVSGSCGNVVIHDGLFNGPVRASGNNFIPSSLVINDGTFYAEGSDLWNVHSSRGAVEINDGTFYMSGYGNYETPTYNISISSAFNKAEINGGTFISEDGYNIDNSANIETDSSYANTGLTINGGYFKGNQYSIKNINGLMTINGGTFEQFGQDNNDYCCILNGYYRVSEPHSITINSGTFSGYNRCIENNGVIDINGGSFSQVEEEAFYSMLIENKGEMTIDGGVFTSNAETIRNGRPYTDEEGTLTINNGTFSRIGQAEKYLRCIYNEEESAFTLNGGTFNIFNTYSCIYSAGRLTINGGKIKANDNCSYCITSSGNTTINDGVLEIDDGFAAISFDEESIESFVITGLIVKGNETSCGIQSQAVTLLVDSDFALEIDSSRDAFAYKSGLSQQYGDIKVTVSLANGYTGDLRYYNSKESEGVTLSANEFDQIDFSSDYLRLEAENVPPGGPDDEPETDCDHSYVTTVIEPTCENRGYTVYTCTKCGHTYTGDYVDATGHSYGEWIVTHEPTDSTTGQRERTCSVCKEKEVEIIPATGTNTPIIVGPGWTPTFSVNTPVKTENGNVSISETRAEENDTVIITVNPDNGYELDKLIVTDDNGNEIGVVGLGNGKFEFTMPATAVSIEATFVEAKVNTFVDVSVADWFVDAVEYVVRHSIMEGISDNEFAPLSTMSRAMVWTILARIDGETVTGSNWIATAMKWATDDGVSDGTDANGLVTREQFATMLWRYAGEPASDYSLAAYTDASGVSDWAQAAMCWAVENGIITGVSATTIDPQGTATRAQAAAMLMRFIENIG